MLAVQVNPTEWLVPLTPLPDSAIEVGELLALLVITICPLSLPVIFGENSTSKFAVWPAERLTPPKPLIVLKALPLTLIWEIATVELPLFVTVTSSVMVPPTLSLPKLRLLLESDRERVAVVPVPLRLIVTEEVLPLLTSVILPEVLLLVVGVNLTVRLTVAAGANDLGMLNWLTLKLAPLTLALEIVSVPEPVFFS